MVIINYDIIGIIDLSSLTKTMQRYRCDKVGRDLLGAWGLGVRKVTASLASGSTYTLTADSHVI